MTHQQSNTVGGADMKDSEGFNIMERKHDNFSIHYCGLFIYPQYHYLGSTSNGIISCQWCGRVALEIECTYCRGQCVQW